LRHQDISEPKHPNPALLDVTMSEEVHQVPNPKDPKARGTGGLGKGTRQYLLKSHKTFLVNRNSGNYSACWPGLGI